MRFLKECPWDRLVQLRERIPNILFQMLLRASNAVGYTNYPDNVVKEFVRRTASAGMDLFRIFDCLNWTENMRVAIDAVCDAGKLAEGAVFGPIYTPTGLKTTILFPGTNGGANWGGASDRKSVV